MKNNKSEEISDMREVPSIVVFFTLWFGRAKTNWIGLRKEFNLSAEIVACLKKYNEMYRGETE